MTIFDFFFIGTIPVILLVLAGMLIAHTSPEGTGSRRVFVFVLAVTFISFLAEVITQLVLPGLADGYWLNMISIALLPSSVAAMALALVQVKLLASLSRLARTLVILLGLGLLAVVIATASPSGFIQLIPLCALLVALLWALGRQSGLVTVLFSLLGLAGLALLNANAFNSSGIQPVPLTIVLAIFAYYICPVLAVFSAALLVSTAFKLPMPVPEAGQPGPAGRRRRAWVRIGLLLGLAAALLGYLAYTIFWISVWAQTNDGVGGLMLVIEGAVGAVAAGLFLSLRFSGRRRLVGLAFAVLVPALLITASNPEWLIYKTITNERAASIQAALAHYQARRGAYPASLADLVPLDMLWVPGPVIQQGEDWCYQGGPEFYRLGAVYREFMGMPVSVRIYASAGTPTSAWDCESRLVLYPAWDVSNPPTLVETPMPTGVVPIPRTVVQPQLVAANILMGTWSPDSSNLVFAQAEDNGPDQRQLRLSFLNAQTGTVCKGSEPFSGTETMASSFAMYQHHAWLPDGRLLFLSPAGDLVLLKPCQAGLESLTTRYPQAFELVATPASKNGRVLLKSKAAFWILDGNSLEAFPVDGVTPNPFAAHWDNFAWSLDGSRLAISRLNGETKKDGSTLFLVDTQGGSVLQSLPLPGSSDQSSPMVEWEDSHELVSGTDDTSILIDFQARPPKITPILKDIFSLDVGIGNISTWASIPNPAADSYHLLVRVDHPRNQAVYLYHSETGAVDVLHAEANQLLIFPDGKSVETARLPASPPSEGEKIDLVWVDSPGRTALQIPVQGHYPRNDLWLSTIYLPATSQLVFSSTQGISLVSVPGGELQRFWSLAGRINNLTAWATVSPDGRVVAAAADGVGLYYFALTP